MRIDGAQSVDRALALLLRVIDDGGKQSLAALGSQVGLAPATCYRLAASLQNAKLIVATGSGRFVPGPALAFRREKLSPLSAIMEATRPILKRLACATKCVAHLGVLESAMVTYLIREGAVAPAIHSEEGKQLEAYCSGIGKMLLASLPFDTREDYLASAPFVALTETTIIEPATLSAELDEIRAQGFARDLGESSPDIQCLAVPIQNSRREAFAALSLSRSGGRLSETHALKLMNRARRQIEEIYARVENA